jgi:DNA-directed RNA polymerase subunit RPC12/RpoP
MTTTEKIHVHDTILSRAVSEQEMIGVCVSCGKQFMGIDPLAGPMECKECGANTLYGVIRAMDNGLIGILEKPEDPKPAEPAEPTEHIEPVVSVHRTWRCFPDIHAVCKAVEKDYSQGRQHLQRVKCETVLSPEGIADHRILLGTDGKRLHIAIVDETFPFRTGYYKIETLTKTAITLIRDDTDELSFPLWRRVLPKTEYSFSWTWPEKKAFRDHAIYQLYKVTGWEIQFQFLEDLPAGKSYTVHFSVFDPVENKKSGKAIVFHAIDSNFTAVIIPMLPEGDDETIAEPEHRNWREIFDKENPI